MTTLETKCMPAGSKVGADVSFSRGRQQTTDGPITSGHLVLPTSHQSIQGTIRYFIRVQFVYVIQ